MKRIVLLLAFAALCGFCLPALAQDAKPLLLQKPTISRTKIAFAFAGDIWIAPRDGGDAVRLTAGAGAKTDPYFSPDGNYIAFTSDYEGNTDVYVIPSAGGEAKRLTYHPAVDAVRGWTPDGKRILFASTRKSYAGFARLYTVAVEGGGLEEELPLPTGFEAAYSPDGARVAYVPLGRAFTAWKKYRGGRTTPIWLANLSDSSVEKVLRENSNDFNPMWVGDKIYFLSDRSGAATIYAYDTRTKQVSQVVANNGLDIKSASAGADGVIAYEQFGALYLLDANAGTSRRIQVHLEGDLPTLRPRFEKVATRITHAELSPTGARAVFEARGDIFTVPAEKGDPRDLTNTSGAAERDPAWSPDGKWIAYFSDESGEYMLHLRAQNGMGEVRKIALGDAPSYYYSPVWSPDGKKIAYTDKRLNLWYVDLEKNRNVKIDTNPYENPFHVISPAWSPDSRFIGYTRQLKNRLAAVFIYSLEENKTRQVTDGLSDARYVVFDKNGKHLFFTASTDIGPTTGWLDMSSYPYRVTRSVYVVVLNKDDASPLAPESDEEKVQDDKKDEKKPDTISAQALNAEQAQSLDQTPQQQTPNAPQDSAAQTANQQTAARNPQMKKIAPTKIDFENISQRVLALPIQARGYVGLDAGKSGTIFLLENPPAPDGDMPGLTLHRFNLSKRKSEKVTDGMTNFAVSANGEKMLYQQGQRWAIVSTAPVPLKPGEGTLNLANMEMRVDPRAEWRQMYREAWRIERDFFYDPNYHGLNLKAAEQRYAPYMDGIAHRADLNYLFNEMLGNLTVGHLYVTGGDMGAEGQRVQNGLLGADFTIENNRYRFAKIYNGENWNPQLRAPLTQPGVNVREGEYLLAVNGRELRATDNVYQFFEGAANKQTVIKVGSDPNGAGAREVTVVPVASEQNLRALAWIEDNRRKVSEMSGGKVGYVYLPNTGGAGFTNFNRYYFAQIDKDGVVIDERFNGGGSAADYIINYMQRPLMNYWSTREGDDFTTPVGSIYGPKAMIINENAGSGGDAIAWYFRHAGVGKLIGKRTWGGLVGIYDYPPLIDGGGVTAPRVAFRNPQGELDVENKGVAPDIEVEYDPQAWRSGHDPQLERAVQVVLDEIRQRPAARPQHGAFPNYQQ